MSKEIKSNNNNIQGNKKHNNMKNNQSISTASKEQLTEWFYMASGEVTAKDLAEVIRPLNLGELDLWEEMNILSMELKDGTTIDFEFLSGGFKDEKDKQFLVKNNYQTIFTVSISEESAAVKELFRKIVTVYPGGFHADSIDFMPSVTTGDLD